MPTIATKVHILLEKYKGIYDTVNIGTVPFRKYNGASQLISEYEKITNPGEADAFFHKFGVGNADSGIHNPFERHLAYELLLKIMKQHDSAQYYKVHKGTPYYIIGWTSYQFLNFRKGIFYMDAAVSEDMKIDGVKERLSSRPSLDFFMIKPQTQGSGIEIHKSLAELVQKSFNNYHIAGGGIISLDNFRDKFVAQLLYSGAEGRSLLSAFYTFLLEYEEMNLQMDLRSDSGGSIQPFIDHLFDGARILESLIEKKREKKGGTLQPKILKTPKLGINQSILKSGNTLASAEIQYNQQKSEGKAFHEYNFASAYIIRNTTGHSLLLPDQFANPGSYRLLYNSLLNSIFWTIERLWLD